MKNKTVRVGDIVEILTEKRGSINRLARVEVAERTRVRVTNTNMPFQGTFPFAWFLRKDVKKY